MKVILVKDEWYPIYCVTTDSAYDDQEYEVDSYILERYLRLKTEFSEAKNALAANMKRINPNYGN